MPFIFDGGDEIPIVMMRPVDEKNKIVPMLLSEMLQTFFDNAHAVQSGYTVNGFSAVCSAFASVVPLKFDPTAKVDLTELFKMPQLPISCSASSDTPAAGTQDLGQSAATMWKLVFPGAFPGEKRKKESEFLAIMLLSAIGRALGDQSKIAHMNKFLNCQKCVKHFLEELCKQVERDEYLLRQLLLSCRVRKVIY